MKVIIVGAGEVGYHTAKVLTGENHDVIVIDESAEALMRVNEHLDLLTVTGPGASPRLLLENGLSDTDLLIAVTNNDEVNILACVMAARYGVGTKVARVSSQEYFADSNRLSPADVGIDLLIQPEQLCAEEFFRLLNTPEAREIVDLAQDRVRLVAFQVRPDSPIGGRPLKDLRGSEGVGDLLIAAVKHEDGSITVPRGQDVIHAGEEVFAVGRTDVVRDLLEYCGKEQRKLQSVIIAGAGRIGLGLAQLLEGAGIHDVKLIEQDIEKAEAASAVLKHGIVLHGNVLDDDTLEEAAVADVDGFVAVTGEDEVDIMACVAAKQRGAARVLSLVQKPRYLPMLVAMPSVDGAVSTHLTAVSRILRLIRRGDIVSLVSLHEINAEVIELMAAESSPATGRPIRDLKFPSDAIIGAIVRGEDVIVPSGEYVIEPGDRVVVLSLPDAIQAVERLFGHDPRHLPRPHRGATAQVSRWAT